MFVGHSLRIAAASLHLCFADSEVQLPVWLRLVAAVATAWAAATLSFVLGALDDYLLLGIIMML